MSRRFRRGTIVAASLAAALVISGGGAAYAYYTVGGGSGAVTNATPQSLTLVTQGAVASLYPGGTGSIGLTVTNPNTNAIHLNSFVLDTTQGDGGFSADAGHASCTTAIAGLTFTPPTNGWDVPARTGGVDGSLDLVLPDGTIAMSVDAASECQGAQFTIFLGVGQ